MQINSFNHFRAIAILLIITGHCYIATGMKFQTVFKMTMQNLITGATSLFVFISGFLFYYVFYPRYQYRKFIFKKIQGVLFPYLILGFIPVFLYVSMRKDVFGSYFLPGGTGVVSEYLIPAFKYYFSGRFLDAYWYIPFIMVTFVLSPFHVKYIRCSLRVQLSLISIFFVNSLVPRLPALEGIS